MRHNEELYELYKDNDLPTTIRLHRLQWAGPVSYTHLDVYKRQLLYMALQDRGAPQI